ncbi:MAG: hypothetical protein JRH16_22375 [Deltaproteobacteria bacterium]|nr:hypothetical protein [Deltaproteobacteria bacterium]MBW2362165.1 hypothetical protein [Deltaproteobacteria bacterium]
MLNAERHAYDHHDALQEDYADRGWTDGLPVVAPTPAKVEAFLDAAGLKAGEVLGEVPTREVVVTAEHAAINAVMAGCKQEYMPVVAAAVRAHLHEKANCHSTTGTLCGAAQVVVVNGPVRKEIEIACEGACFGPGFRANATIGRALRLVIRNVCRAIPDFLDRASFSSPLRYSFCFGENEEGSPWLPMHVERGFAPDQSTVTVHSIMHFVSAIDFTARTPEAVLDTILATLRRYGVFSDRFLGDGQNVMLVVGPEHMRFFAEEGWSKDDMRGYLWPKIQKTGAGERPIMLGQPEGMLITAAGGPGMAETWLLIPHLAWAITEPIS